MTSPGLTPADALRLRRRPPPGSAWPVRLIPALSTIQTLPGKHYFQEDMAPEVATAMANFVEKSGSSQK